MTRKPNLISLPFLSSPVFPILSSLSMNSSINSNPSALAGILVLILVLVHLAG